RILPAPTAQEHSRWAFYSKEPHWSIVPVFDCVETKITMVLSIQQLILGAIGLLVPAEAEYPTRMVRNPYTEASEQVPYNPCTGSPLVCPRGGGGTGFIHRVDMNPFTGMIYRIAGAGAPPRHSKCLTFIAGRMSRSPSWDCRSLRNPNAW